MVCAASRSTAAPTIHVTSWQTLKFSTGALAQDTVVIDGVVFLGEHIPERFLAGHLHSRHCGHGNVFGAAAASAASNRWRGINLSGWDPDCANIAHWYSEG
jgi:hypothetical protein